VWPENVAGELVGNLIRPNFGARYIVLGARARKKILDLELARQAQHQHIYIYI
jgi:hypothetical protein